MYPRLYLAVDNCFASKRWTKPDEWVEIVKDAGANYIEASADNECDPLYTPQDVLSEWVEAVKSACQRYDASVCNLYSGHGTYATLGLAHSDTRVREHIQHQWLEPMIDWAAELNAGLGFYCHAFSQSTLRDPARYKDAVNDLVRRFAELAIYAGGKGLSSIGVEQMYSPHQIPWTVTGAENLLRDVYAQGNYPFYITLDTGHQVGQHHFGHPSPSAPAQTTGNHRDAFESGWSGYYDLSLNDDALPAYVQEHAYLFAEPDDGDLYTWIERLGGYSPIIHLQQTDGRASAHRPFTEQNNRDGKVVPVKLLESLSKAYTYGHPEGLPARCTDIYLTLEIFSGTAERPANILRNIRESVAYWRQFIPEDGLPLNQLVG